MKEKVLVTGAAGFIGSHLVDLLLESGYEVFATDLPSASKEFLNPNATFVPGDLAVKSDMQKLFTHPGISQVKIVFHLGAIFDMAPSWEVMERSNAQGTQNVLEQFVKLPRRDKRFIMYSSGVVHSDVLRMNNYGRSKYKQEIVLRKFLHKLSDSDKFEAVIVRPAAVIGPRSRYGAAKILQMVAGGQMQFYVGKENPVAPLIHVYDIVRATMLLSQVSWEKIKKVCPGLEPPAFDMVSDSVYKYEELIDYIGWLTELDYRTKILPIRMSVWVIRIAARWQELLAKILKTKPKLSVDMLDFFVADMVMHNYAIKELGFKFKYPDIKPAIIDTLDWYKLEGWL